MNDSAPETTSAIVEAIDALDVRQLSQRVSEKWNTFPPEILPAWVAEMDFPLAPCVRGVIEEAARTDDLGYPIAPNATGLRESFATRMATRFDWPIEPERVEILSEVMQGLFIAIHGLTPEGSTIVAQPPVYPPFLRAVRESGRNLVENHLVPGVDGYEIDFDDLERAMAGGARALLFCNPQNPTGRVFRRDELERVADLAERFDVLVICDEIHADLVYGDAVHVPMAALSPEMAKRTITLNSASKSFNLPGLRCAVAHFGSSDLQKRFVQSVPRRIRGGLGLLGLYATIAAWQEGQAWLDEIVGYLDGNRRHLAEALNKRFPEISHFTPEGTYMTWLDCNRLELGGSAARYFRDHGQVALTEGRPFGAAYEGFARINFATSRSILDHVIDRMGAALSR